MAGRPKLVSVNPAITCSLCKGYLINAMRLCRCMHAFCRSCIHRYLDTSSTCPTCQQRVFRSRMDVHMLPDHELQSIVYRVVPGLYEDEMRRRREYYENSDDRSDEHTEEKGFPERVILSDKDKVSVVLAYRDNEEYPKLYLELAAAMPVSVLLNFLRDKCKPLPTLVVHLILEQKGVGTKEAPDRLLLDPDFTIIDVCYIAKYNLQGPLKLTFTFVQFDPESFKDKRLLESSAMSESSILRKSLNHRYRDEKVNGHNGVANQAVKNVQYAKVKTDNTKSIVLSKNPAVESAVNSMKTYSRNAGSNGGNGNICQLTDGVVAGANASEGDSTEEEVDSWDSNVSTTIDSLTNSSQQHSSQQQQPPSSSGSSYAGKPNKAATAAAAAAAATAATATNAGAVPSSGPSPASKSSKHSKSSAGASSIHGNNTSLIAARPQSLRIDAMREKSDKPAGKQAISPVVQQSAPVGHHKRASQEKKSHHHHHHHHHKNHNASSTSTASASTVAGKPPTVLKIKLNTSPTTSETLTITSPPIRETRLKALEYPAVTSIKIKPIIAPPSPPSSSSSPSSSRETRAGSVESSGRKKRRSEDRDRTIKDKSPSEEEPAAPKKTKKAKTKKTTSQNTQAVINDTAYVSDQPKDLLSTSNFGWGDSSLWESQLRIPSPLTVPLTVSVARRRANQTKSQIPASPLPPPTSSSFLEENFSLKKNKVVVKPAHNRIWRKRRHVSPPPVPVKLPPPDFKMSSTLSAVLEAVRNDRFSDVQRALGSSPQRVTTSPSSSPLRDCYFSKPAADHNDFPSRRQSETDHFLDSGVRPGSSSSGDINADVFRMEFPVAAINPPTTAVSPKLDRSQSYTSASPQSQVCQENLRRLSSSSSSASSPPSSCAQVKFSIHNILSSESSPPQNKIEQNNESKETNIQETIEMFITNISKFFWALEASKGRVSARMSKTFLAKRSALEKILTLLRKLTIVVAPNQIERVLQLDSAIQKYFQTDLHRGLVASDAHEQLRSPLESLRPDTLRRLEQNDVKVTPIYPKNPSENISNDRIGGVAVEACIKNGTDRSLSIVCLTSVSELPAESTILPCGDAARLDSEELRAEVVPSPQPPLEVEAEAAVASPETCENREIDGRPIPSDLKNETSESESDTNRFDKLESPKTSSHEKISDSQAFGPERDTEDICSDGIKTFEDVKSALDSLLDSVERSLEVTPVSSTENELVDTTVNDGKLDVGVMQVEGTSLVETETQSQIFENDPEARTSERDVLLHTNADQMELDRNESEQMQVDQVSDPTAQPRASSSTGLRCENDELQFEPEPVPADYAEHVPIPFAEPLPSVGDDLSSADSEMHVEATGNQIDGNGSLSNSVGDHEEPVQVPEENRELQTPLVENGVGDDLVQLDLTETESHQNEVPAILKVETEPPFSALTFVGEEIGVPVEDTEEPMDVTEDLVESLGTSSQATAPPSIDTPGGMLEDVENQVQCTEVRIESIEVDFNEVVDPHVNQSNSEVVQTENYPKNECKEHEADVASRQQAYDGSFGYNSCQSVVPYVPVRPKDSFCWVSDAFRSKLGESAILGLFPRRVPRISFVENEVSTCDPAPKTHKTGLELVPYVPRSANPIENLFRLNGLIPERVPIPSPVHDYIMKGDPTGIPNSGKQTKTHSLLDFLKLQQKSHVVQQNTSPNFGDIDMDVHRWEEVDELGGVAPPSGVANVPGSLNVH